MSRVHNKRRNAGVLYELLLRNVVLGTVEGRTDAVETTLKVIRRHFKPGSELYREFRLFHALSKVRTDSDRVVDTILTEARREAQRADSTALEKEKTSLVHSVNKLADVSPGLLEQRIPDFRSLATVQRLLNAWRDPKGANPVEVAKLEEGVRTWLRRPEEIEQPLESLGNQAVDPLALRIMRERLESNLRRDLSTEQVTLLREHVLAEGSNRTAFTQKLEQLRGEAIRDLETYLTVEKSEIVREKSKVVLEKIKSLDLSRPDDAVVGRVMQICALRDEINRENA